uniref:Transmembrane protein 144 n=1 Tax=Ditylenchus dipsaci TaxID=166011 RepID=A0A915CTV9_9BILA
MSAALGLGACAVLQYALDLSESCFSGSHNCSNVRKKVTETVTVENETSSLMPQTNVTSTTTTTVKDEVTTSANAQPSSALKLKLMAIGFSMLAGVCYGLTFVPVIYIQDNPETFKNPPKEAIYYAFSHFSGILVTSTVVLLGYYCILGTILLFLANDLLSQAITFPINAMMPGVCAALWSVFYFKEITGAKNLRLLMAAVLITLVALLL